MHFHKNLLLMRFTLLNVGMAVLAFVAWRFEVFADSQDSSYISYAILAMFGVGWVLNAKSVLACSFFLDDIIAGKAKLKPDASVRAIRTKLDSAVNPIEFIAYTLITLGFLGTVWGFKTSLSGIDISNVGDVDSIVPMVTLLLKGMGIAIWTTVWGIVGYLALSFNIRLLEGGHDRVYHMLLSGGRDGKV